MKKYFSEYGHITVAAIVVSLLVAMASPVGNLIKASTTELVNTCGDSTNNFVNSFEVTDLNGPTVNLISFTIEGTEYQAEEGMTWAEWVESENNPGNFSENGATIIKDGYRDVAKEDYFSLPHPSDLIIANYSYTTVMG